MQRSGLGVSQAGPEKGSVTGTQQVSFPACSCGKLEQRAGFLWGCNVSQCWLERPGRARAPPVGVGLPWPGSSPSWRAGETDAEEAGADLSSS